MSKIRIQDILDAEDGEIVPHGFRALKKANQLPRGKSRQSVEDEKKQRDRKRTVRQPKHIADDQDIW